MKRLKIIFLIVFLLFVILYFIPVKVSSIEAIPDVHDSIFYQLRQFRSQPLKKIKTEKTEWTYFSGGNGNTCLFFIHGMGGAYDFWFQQILFFQKNFRVISCNIPDDVKNLNQISKGLIAILDNENIRKCIFTGTSMGGYIVQYMVQHHPERVEKAVIGNSFPPNDEIKKEMKSQRRLMPFIPKSLVYSLYKKNLRKKVFPTSENHPLVKAMLLSAPFRKKTFINRFDIITEIFPLKQTDSANHIIPKLIIESDNDPLITQTLREKLKKLYYNADIFTFKGKGHFPYLNQPEKYNEILLKFVNDSASKR
ncbi:MAG: alpha/beta hydrolase [Chitinophagaceae bacterium]|nr:alpha/beta hydrolase [Chitinophagaceae bacterium]